MVNLLWQIAVAVSKGKRRRHRYAKNWNFVERTYLRWWKEHDGLQAGQAKPLKELEQENVMLKRLLGTLSLDELAVMDIVLESVEAVERRRSAADHFQQHHGLTELRACVW